MVTCVSISNRTIAILVPLFPIVPGEVYIAFSTPWGQKYLGSMPIIFFLQACEVRVEGKKGSGRYTGRYLLHVCEQGTFTVCSKQLPACGSTKGTSNVHCSLKDHQQQGHHYRRYWTTLRTALLRTRTHIAFLLGLRPCCPIVMITFLPPLHGGENKQQPRYYWYSLFQFCLLSLSGTVGTLISPPPPLDAFTRRSQDIFHITKPSLWPFSFFFQKAMFLSVSLPLPKLSGLRYDFTLLTITVQPVTSSRCWYRQETSGSETKDVIICGTDSIMNILVSVALVQMDTVYIVSLYCN